MSFDSKSRVDDKIVPMTSKRRIIISQTDQNCKLRLLNGRRVVIKTINQSFTAPESHKRVYLPDGRSVVFVLSKTNVSFYGFFKSKIYIDKESFNLNKNAANYNSQFFY
jgi:hypothetical protein